MHLLHQGEKATSLNSYYQASIAPMGHTPTQTAVRDGAVDSHEQSQGHISGSRIPSALSRTAQLSLTCLCFSPSTFVLQLPLPLLHRWACHIGKRLRSTRLLSVLLPQDSFSCEVLKSILQGKDSQLSFPTNKGTPL